MFSLRSSSFVFVSGSHTGREVSSFTAISQKNKWVHCFFFQIVLCVCVHECVCTCARVCLCVCVRERCSEHLKAPPRPCADAGLSAIFRLKTGFECDSNVHINTGS